MKIFNSDQLQDISMRYIRVGWKAHSQDLSKQQYWRQSPELGIYLSVSGG